MTRRPGYDIDGQPTRVDPRDFPDPLTLDPDGEPLGFGQQWSIGRPGPLGCWWWAALLALALLVLLAGCSAQPAGNATPRTAPDLPAQSGAPLDPAISSVGRAGAAGFPDGSSAGSIPARGANGGAPPLTPEVLAGGTAGTAADVTYSGIVNYAEPGLGRWYLAIPDGKGVAVTICGPAGCLDRVSTDAGPDLAMQRAGRIADLNSVDWLTISGVPLRYGGFQGTILIVKRPPRIELPQTDSLEGP